MLKNFSDLLSYLNLPDDFSLIVVADGSGTTWKKSCGSQIYCRHINGTEELQCSFSNGTNNFAEMIPFVYTLSYFGLDSPFLFLGKVLFVSDSQLTVKQGTKEFTRENQPLWGTIEKFEQFTQIIWKWVPRNVLELSKLCDKGAKEANKLYKDFLTKKKE